SLNVPILASAVGHREQATSHPAVTLSAWGREMRRPNVLRKVVFAFRGNQRTSRWTWGPSLDSQAATLWGAGLGLSGRPTARSEADSPAKAGVQGRRTVTCLDPRFRGGITESLGRKCSVVDPLPLDMGSIAHFPNDDGVPAEPTRPPRLRASEWIPRDGRCNSPLGMG